MITGKMLRDAFISAAANIANQRKAVDALNVFPVPDGDTGTNMSMTMNAVKRELLLLGDNTPVSDVAATAASAMLRGARGNSGVILSLLFRGVSKKLVDKKAASAQDLTDALESGVRSAYKAVMKPTEGTVLTVARESAQEAANTMLRTPDIAAADLWQVVLDEACASLERTPDLLPVLKKAGVVDAGGKGLVLIFEGMQVVFSGGDILTDVKEDAAQYAEMPTETNAAGEYEGEITFTYCTEYTILKEGNNGGALSLRAYLESIGDSVVVVEDDEIIKCHPHTDNPGNAMQKGLEFGMLSNMKIDNMRLQHASQKKAVAAGQEQQRFPYAPVDPKTEYGFVSVAAGDGIKALFHDLGVQNVVNGGQTMNPSTDDLLAAIHATPARTVIVLPNNKNIIMTAEQTTKLADRHVYVLPTKNIPQGLSALLAFDPEANLRTNQLTMVKTLEKVGVGQVTFAARDSTFDGHKIRKNEILALENGKISFTDKQANKAAYRLIRSLLRKHSTFVTVLYGSDVTDDQAEELKELLLHKLPDSVELAVINGGQPVYYYIVSVE